MGVYYCQPKKRWIARSKMVKGNRIYIGAYKTEAEAENAYAIYELTKITTANLPLQAVEVPYVPQKLNPFSFVTRWFKKRA